MRAIRTIFVPYALDSAPFVRRRLRVELTAAGVAPDAVDDAIVVVSELLGNALRHARPLPDGSLRIQWSLSGDLLCLAVSDGGGSSQPSVRAVGAFATGGRGLSIVATLAREWGVRRDAGETTVWATLSRAPARAQAAHC